MPIWDFNYTELEYQAMPFIYTFKQGVNWVNAICKPIEWLRDCFFTSFAKGGSATAYSELTAYTVGQRVQYGEAIYECSIANTGNIPTTSPDYWVVVTADRVGINTRIRYLPNKLVFEFALNQRFKTAFRQPNNTLTPTPSDIYIQNSSVNIGFFIGQNVGSSIGLTLSSEGIPQNAVSLSNNFVIYVPIAKYTSLGANAEQIIRFWADKINMAGMLYTIQTY
jgi:hypothetical protein